MLWSSSRAPSKEPRVAAADRHEGESEREERRREEHEWISPRSHVHRASAAELAVRNRVTLEESQKIQRKLAASKLLAERDPRAKSAPATQWVSLGPSSAPQEFNYFKIDGDDVGRPSGVAVDPRNEDIVYVAMSGRGVWKTFDFTAEGGATWFPLTDNQPNLAVGAFVLDRDKPETLYVASGDFVDASGNTVMKSTDGGISWSTPVVLAGKYPNDLPAAPRGARAISVAGDTVFVGTDAGLFKSTDAGASFTLVDLPNANDAVLLESIWSVAPIGGGGWIASGVTACAEGAGPPGLTANSGASDASKACPLGSNAAIWRSTDGKAWSLVTDVPAVAGTGRITLATGPTFDAKKTVVYAYVGAVDGFSTFGFWRSMDAGATWKDASGTLANPTIVDKPNEDDSCADLDVAHEQAWYNQAIVVDPKDADHVLVGGNLCSMRTLNGTDDAPVWENVSHWLPGNQYGETANGRLGYVHADWHTAASFVVNGKVKTFGGTDGGLFASPNVFNPGTQAEKVTWKNYNRGLVTTLSYSIASGDPAEGNAFQLLTGLQDNGTRFRTDPKTPDFFNEPVGGDGFGVAIHVGKNGGTTYWATSTDKGRRHFCKAADYDCSVETPEPMDDKDVHWKDMASAAASDIDLKAIDKMLSDFEAWSGEDSEPFVVRYANVETDKDGQSVLTHTGKRVFVSEPDGDGFKWTQISQDLTADPAGGFTNVTASRTIPGLYGASGLASAEPFWISTTGNTPSIWTVAKPVFPVGDTKRLTGAASIDFPPVTPAGKQPGDVFVGSFTNTMNDPARTPPPDDKGRLYRTTDRGQTWTSIVGADPAHRLPNVPVYVVKYDPVTPTTIYAGTDIGVYITTDDGATWDRMGEGLPMISVRDIYVARNQEFIRIATYGRGIWEIYPSATENHGASGTGDYDRNQRIDWIDLAAMSTRLGTTPATTAKPFYTWIMDMMGAGDAPTQSIGDEDLSALIAKFGGHP